MDAFEKWLESKETREQMGRIARLSSDPCPPLAMDAVASFSYRAGMRAAAEVAGKQRDWAIGSDDYNNGCTHCQDAILAEADK